MRHLYLIIACFLLASCSEEQIPEPQIADPVFSARGTASASPFVFKAGLNGYYMFSEFSQDKNGVYDYIGDLRSASSPIQTGLKIEIRASEATTPGGLIDIFESLKTGFYQYREPDVSDKFAALQMNPLSSGSSLTYDWDFGDGYSSNLRSPVHRYKEPGFYQVSLKITDAANNCTSSLTNVVDFFKYDLNELNNCTADFSLQTGSNNMVNLSSLSANADVYYWDFGDGNTGFGKTANHTYDQPGVYKVNHVTYRSLDSCSREFAMDVSVGSSGNCSANFNIERVVNASPDSLELSRVRVEWTDPVNGIFSSDRIIQRSEDSFEIIEVESYKENEKGEKTVKLRCRFSCELVNEESAQSIRLENVECVFAFAYPS